jgi:hypothetical protein
MMFINSNSRLIAQKNNALTPKQARHLRLILQLKTTQKTATKHYQDPNTTIMLQATTLPL